MIFYKVYFQPLKSAFEYYDEIDVSDYILKGGLSTIKRTNIDSMDYDIGVFAFSNITIKALNFNGIFSDNDSRSIFTYKRNRCKVRVELNIYDDGETTKYNVFKGIINEKATKIDFESQNITFTILGYNSILSEKIIYKNQIKTGETFKETLTRLFNGSLISSLLTYNIDNINPKYDFIIDDATVFENIKASEVINNMLNASCSIMYIDIDGNIIIQERKKTSDYNTLNLYGDYCMFNKPNILSITDYNTGYQRMFNTIKINETSYFNQQFVNSYGIMEKSTSYDFITNTNTEEQIAYNIVDEFKSPKKEMIVTVETKLLFENDINVFDYVTIDYPLRYTPPQNLKDENEKLPFFGVAKFGQSRFPNTFGCLKIDNNIGFKIIDIEDDTQNFISKIKLREIGKELNDGYINLL